MSTRQRTGTCGRVGYVIHTFLTSMDPRTDGIESVSYAEQKEDTRADDTVVGDMT